MKTPDTSSPAFPGLYSTPGYGCARRNASGELEEHTPGMTLRDYFAAKALQALIGELSIKKAILDAEESLPSVAALAFDFADAMIAQREKLE